MIQDGWTPAQIAGMIFGSAVFGYLLGIWVYANYRLRVVPRGNICSCHNPIRYAIWKYTGIGCLLLLGVLSGCATLSDMEKEEVQRKALEKGVYAQNEHFVQKINQTIDRVKVLEDRQEQLISEWDTMGDRVLHLERLAAPGDPDGLAEEPDLFDFEKALEEAARKTDEYFCRKARRDGSPSWIIDSCNRTGKR